LRSLSDWLEHLVGSLATPWPKIAKPQPNGEDLALNRLVETISSSCMNPVNVVHGEEETATELQSVHMSKQQSATGGLKVKAS
jgi:hypothetical protein